MPKVLWFLRTPDDPDFDPIKEIIQVLIFILTIISNLLNCHFFFPKGYSSKAPEACFLICSSLYLVYNVVCGSAHCIFANGAPSILSIVVCVLPLFWWKSLLIHRFVLPKVFPSLLPLHVWSQNPIYEGPMDLLLVHVALPFIFKYVHPKETMKVSCLHKTEGFEKSADLLYKVFGDFVSKDLWRQIISILLFIRRLWWAWTRKTCGIPCPLCFAGNLTLSMTFQYLYSWPIMHPPPPLVVD